MKPSLFIIGTMLFGLSSSAYAADFPLASCGGWGATLVQRTGVDSKQALITGIVTQADFTEYCERDPGGETIKYGGKLTVEQCISQYQREVGNQAYRSVANCSTRQLTFFSPKRKPKTISFPLPEDADTSCASGMPPLIAQFKLLCPTVAAKYNIE